VGKQKPIYLVGCFKLTRKKKHVVCSKKKSVDVKKSTQTKPVGRFLIFLGEVITFSRVDEVTNFFVHYYGSAI
jgi:hypothetical protein